MAGIGIISNPYSKLNRKNPKRSDYLSYIAGKKGHVAITKTIDELASVAVDFKKQDISILAINGGDGTISQTLTVFHKIYDNKPLPKIALLRGGTMNVLASNLKIKGSPEHILYQLIEKHSTGRWIPAMSINSLVIEGQLGFLFANGTPANFLQKFYENKKGSLGAAWMVAKVVLSRFLYQRFYHKIVTHSATSIGVDSQKNFERKTIAVLISTLAKMPLGPKLFPAMESHVGNSPHHQAQLVAYAADPLKASVLVPWDAFVLPTKDTAIKTRRTGKSFVIITESSMLYTLDGELYHPSSKSLEINVGPAFDFLAL